jgi:hypothetical protein
MNYNGPTPLVFSVFKFTIRCTCTYCMYVDYVPVYTVYYLVQDPMYAGGYILIKYFEIE